MGGLRSIRRGIAAAIIALSVSMALTSCENALMTYLFKGILYQGWKVAQWSAAAPVVEGQTHVVDPDLSNGYPMNMAMGVNGKLHLIGHRVEAKELVYTSLEPGAPEFEQAFKPIIATPYNCDGTGITPGIDLMSDDVPIIAYGLGGATGTHSLYYQEYVSGTWQSAQMLETSGSEYAPSFAYFFSSDFKTHIWYLSSGSIYHRTADTGPSVEWLTEVGWMTAVRIAADDIAFVYTDTAKTTLYFRTWKGTSSTPIWTAPADIGIGEMSMTLDSNGAAHLCFGAYKPADQANTSFYSLHYLSNAGGAWRALESIDGNATAGPTAWLFPASIDVAPDRYGNDHVHLAYAVYTPPFNHSVWYTYYEETGWHSPQNLDTQHTNSFFTFPLIAVDPAGTVHVVYSWAVTEQARTMMYVRGTPGEPQNQ